MKIIKTANYQKIAEEESDNREMCSCSNCGHSFLADKSYELNCPQCDSPRVS
jgi:ribosomal protein S27AE